MNIKQTLSMPIKLVLEKLGAKHHRTSGNEDIYYSPFRNERTPSFYVNTKKNVWNDFGTGDGGNSFQLVKRIFALQGRPNTEDDIHDWFKEAGFDEAPIIPSNSCDTIQINDKIKINRIRNLTNNSLIAYLENRGIPPHIGEQYLKEIYYLHVPTNKKYFAVCFGNVEHGWELRSPTYKGSISPKTVSFFKGKKSTPRTINIFEGFMDLLSIVTRDETREDLDKMIKGDVIVLNSLSCLSKAYPFIKGKKYEVLRTWLDNDLMGETANKALQGFCNFDPHLKMEKMSPLYANFKDVNDWHVHTPVPE